MNPQRIVLYGDSLVLASLAASLKQYPSFEVISLDASDTSARMAQNLRALHPMVVIFDLGTIQPEIYFSALDAQPDLLLIGVDAAGDKLLVLSGKQSHALSTADLVQVIRQRVPANSQR